MNVKHDAAAKRRPEIYITQISFEIRFCQSFSIITYMPLVNCGIVKIAWYGPLKYVVFVAYSTEHLMKGICKSLYSVPIDVLHNVPKFTGIQVRISVQSKLSLGTSQNTSSFSTE